MDAGWTMSYDPRNIKGAATLYRRLFDSRSYLLRALVRSVAGDGEVLFHRSRHRGVLVSHCHGISAATIVNSMQKPPNSPWSPGGFCICGIVGAMREAIVRLPL